eukprot:gene6441-6508_t
MTLIRLDGPETSVILHATPGEPPALAYWGARLHHADAVEIALIGTRQGMHGVADVAHAPSLIMEQGLGFGGPSGLALHRGGQDWAPRLVVEHAARDGATVVLRCRDARAGLELTHTIMLDPATDVLRIGARITNCGTGVVELDDMMTAWLPIPAAMTEIISFAGRWAFEFQQERLPRRFGRFVRENRAGRTGHASYPAMIACTAATGETVGEAYGWHLAWSGNHRLALDSAPDGRVFAGAGALILPGEVRLAPGEAYDSPELVAAYSDAGLTALSRKFHKHVRTCVLRPALRARPRPVHYNTWEAVYFDHDTERLKAIATRAAAIGVERFVLDDGWFGARRNDQAGLGDWTVSPDVYPEGLGPLIDHVRSLGMEMGIWFEPEMVNPDSDLYRAHPDWVLHAPGIAQVPFRNQLALDIARPEVAATLFAQIDAILSAYPVGYVKWDMNRDLSHPGNAAGQAAALAQVRAFYALLDRLRTKHPMVEIESCASGGGRADYGALAHTDRVWTSDSNDARDRQLIQRGASLFLPPEVMGAHVGPAHCHITGRRLSMAFRAATALMGHMGMELDILNEPEADLAELAQAVLLYKRHRALIHTGAIQRLDTPAHVIATGVIAPDRSEALFSVAVLDSVPEVLPAPLRLAGLDPAMRYRLRLVWPQGWQARKAPSLFERLDLGGEGAVISGEALMRHGLQWPASFPETCLILHLERDQGAGAA